MTKKYANKLLSPNGGELIATAIGEVPLLGTIVEMALYQFRSRQIERIHDFLNSIDLDENELLEITEDSPKQELLMQYITTMANTPNQLTCIALALIFKNKELGESLKSLAAHSLQGITQGTLNVFIPLLEYVTQKDGPRANDYGKFKLTGRPLSISPAEVGIIKDKREVYAFCSDLISRNICSKGTIIADDGNFVGINEFSILIYDNLNQAKELLNSNQSN